MKLQIVACAALVLGFAQSSLAADSIVGKWKMTGQECSSGAPAKNALNGVGSFSVDAVIDASTIAMNAQIQVKIDAAKAEAYIQQLDQAVAQLAQQPDSPQKQQALQQIAEAKAQIQKYEAGVSCTSQTNANYSIVGNDQIQVTVTAASSTCNGAPSNSGVGTTSISKFQVNGDVLKISDDKPVTSADAACPVGDTTITVLARQP